MAGGVPVYCGVCHQRLFDLTTEASGGIEIKCPRCRRVVRIRLGDGKGKME